MYLDTPFIPPSLGSPLEAVDALHAVQVFPSADALAALLDHTLLKPEATAAQVETLCQETLTYHFACAMVNPVWVPAASQQLRGAGARVGTVIGFPLGASLAQTKAAEARHAASAGAQDLDMVLNLGMLRSGLVGPVQDEIAEIARISHGEGAILKVILETCLLTQEEKGLAAKLCVEAGVDFVKTSTGFSSSGATEADVRLLRSVVGERCGVKASGGIRTLADAVHMVQAGANRIGASASVAIVQAWQALEG